MAVTLQDVLAVLGSDEPRYEAAARSLGAEALPFLAELVRGEDTMLASKAAYLAGLIDAPASEEVLAEAAASPEVVVRAAAAGAAQHLSAGRSDRILERLLADDHVDVRRLAAQSVHGEVAPRLRATLEGMAEGEPDPSVRSLSLEAVRRLRRR
jgi:HEAT repeats